MSLFLNVKISELIFSSKKINELNKKLEEIYNLCEKFYGIRNVYFVKDTKGKLGKKDSPTDMGNDVYEELFKNKNAN